MKALLDMTLRDALINVAGYATVTFTLALPFIGYVLWRCV